MPEAAERRTSLPPPEGLEDDFVSLDHPVRELPGLLEDIERRARDRARPESKEVDEAGEAAGDRRRLKVRRWAVLVLAATAAVFLYLERTGIEPEAFSWHAPLLAIALLVVVSGTFRPMPPGIPKNPVGYAFVAAIAFWFLAALTLQLKDLYPERAGLFQAVYVGLGVVALLAAVWVYRKPFKRAGDDAPPPEASRQAIGADPYGSRLRVLAACRQALEQISRHAPNGAQARGWLDLAGPEVPHKLVSDDRKGQRYEDQWWRLRLPWEDGVRLRVVGIEKALVRPNGEHEASWALRAKLSVNRRLWRTEPGPFRPESVEGLGGLKVENFEVTPSRVSARIVAEEWAFQPDDLVGLIRVLEERIQPLAPVGGEA